MRYYAIIRTGDSDYLSHFKYISRIKKNGKWVYTYPDQSRDDYNKNAVNTVAKLTGMDEKYIQEAKDLGDKYGYESKQYKDAARVLSEGDPETEKKMSNIFKFASSKGGRSHISAGKDRTNRLLNRPLGRQRNITGQGKPIYRRGSGLNN